MLFALLIPLNLAVSLTWSGQVCLYPLVQSVRYEKHLANGARYQLIDTCVLRPWVLYEPTKITVEMVLRSPLCIARVLHPDGSMEEIRRFADYHAFSSYDTRIRMLDVALEDHAIIEVYNQAVTLWFTEESFYRSAFCFAVVRMRTRAGWQIVAPLTDAPHDLPPILSARGPLSTGSRPERYLLPLGPAMRHGAIEGLFGDRSLAVRLTDKDGNQTRYLLADQRSTKQTGQP